MTSLPATSRSFTKNIPTSASSSNGAPTKAPWLVVFAGGVAPDLVQGIGPWATALGPRGILLPLIKVIDGPDGVPREAFVDDLWSFSVVDGNTYQLAVDSNERALFVSVDAAEMAGIDPYESPVGLGLVSSTGRGR